MVNNGFLIRDLVIFVVKLNNSELPVLVLGRVVRFIAR